MRKTALWGSFVLVALGGLVALPFAFATGDPGTRRDDCPGTVICPLTGEEVCKDRCPLAAAKVTASTRADCTGTIECPLTGDEICKDQCPLKVTAAAKTDELPPCCRGAKK